MTLDDLELLYVGIFREYLGISQIWEATAAKRIKIDPYCQRQRCKPPNVLFNIMFLAFIRRIVFFARFLFSYMQCCRALTLALARLSC